MCYNQCAVVCVTIFAERYGSILDQEYQDIHLKNIRLESFQYFIDYMHNQRSVLAYNDNEQRHILMQLTTFHFQLLL